MKTLRRGFLRGLGLGMISLVLIARLVQADMTYVMDDLGRLAAVIDPATETALYSYDKVGNLLGIARRSSALLSLIEFAPKCGAPAQVTLWGTGYSATPSQNTVTVGGLAAAVTSATATTLVISVPPGASGTLTVTTPSGSTTSSQSFTAGAC